MAICQPLHSGGLQDAYSNVFVSVMIVRSSFHASKCRLFRFCRFRPRFGLEVDAEFR